MRFSHRLLFRTCSRRHLESRDHCHTVAAVIVAPIVFLQVPLRLSSTALPSRGNLTIIGASTRRHAPSKDSAQKLTCSTRRHAPSRIVRLFHAPARSRSSPANVSLRWCHHCHVICWRHSPPSTDVIDHWVWPWTFLQGWLFLSPGSSYLVFRVDFIFAICFCILCL